MEVALLDTDVISFILKGDTRAELYQPHLENRQLAISFMTVAELLQWAEIRNWGDRRKQQLEEALQDYLVLPFDFELCRCWAKVRAQTRSKGRPISPQDGWIAATAMQYQLTLITNNLSDFEAVEGIMLISAQEEDSPNK